MQELLDKPLTAGMKNLLLELSVREKADLPPLFLHHERHAVGLLKRGYIDLCDCLLDGKIRTCIKINQPGRVKVVSIEAASSRN